MDPASVDRSVKKGRNPDRLVRASRATIVHPEPARPSRLSLAVALALALALPSCAREPEAPAKVEAPGVSFLVGTYTRGDSRGIYRFRLDPGEERVEPPSLAAESTNPAFLAPHPGGRLLYSVNEMGEFEGRPTGAVSAFALDPETGALELLNQVSSGGRGPCHLAVDPSGNFVVVANYGGGSVSVLPIRGDGSLDDPATVIQHEGSGVHPRRQLAPHVHCVRFQPGTGLAYVADLGLDRVFRYRLDVDSGGLFPDDTPFLELAPGAGPRHVDFSPDGGTLYVAGELDSTITTFRVAPGSPPDRVQTVSTLPPGFTEPNTTAEIRVSPDGRFVYISNRGHDSIAVFRVSGARGELEWVSHASVLGRTPRNFNLDPSGRFLVVANQNSDTLVLFRIDPTTGELHPRGEPVPVPSPVCVLFIEDVAGG
jgi:6-phosphogluconolactonase